jgi:hypothetical protein
MRAPLHFAAMRVAAATALANTEDLLVFTDAVARVRAWDNQ